MSGCNATEEKKVYISRAGTLFISYNILYIVELNSSFLMVFSKKLQSPGYSQKTLAIDIYPAWKYESCICARTETKCSTGVAPPPPKKRSTCSVLSTYGGKLKNCLLEVEDVYFLSGLSIASFLTGPDRQVRLKTVSVYLQNQTYQYIYSKKLTQSKIMDVKCQTTFNLIHNVNNFFAHKEVAKT